MEPILSVNNLGKTFAIKTLLGRTKGEVSAVDGVSFSLGAKGTLGIVGESGCGKSTLARLLMRLIEPDAGEVRFEGQDILQVRGQQLKRMRRSVQMVFQNPYSSINPHLSVLDNVAFSLWANGVGKQEARMEAYRYLDAVGLSTAHAGRLPNQLSGGQRQRVAIARALILQPRVLIADEAVSALDKSVQAQVLNLFQDLKKEFSLSLIFISHDLHVVEYMSDEVLVMYLGKVVEKGPAQRIFDRPAHPYTKALIGSAPAIERGERQGEPTVLSGELPSPLHPPSGCRFRTRCPFASDGCAVKAPPLREVSQGHEVACVLYEEGVSA